MARLARALVQLISRVAFSICARLPHLGPPAEGIWTPSSGFAPFGSFRGFHGFARCQSNLPNMYTPLSTIRASMLYEFLENRAVAV